MPDELKAYRIVFRRSAAALFTSDWTRFAPSQAAAEADAARALDEETAGSGVLILVQPTADPRSAAPRPATYADWQKALELEFIAATGIDLRDCADLPFRDWYDDELTPAQAAQEAMEQLDLAE